MNATEQDRLAECWELIDRSIRLHGGPYGPCHEAEELILKAIHLGHRDWQRQAAA